ncbi:hypothetical protein C1H46_012882 [Malus baccata]|uniref:Uncharacterized protein n=1 Tax=Malus baccata TaxID=106549 RepID=A0A540MRU6_MALBA|nr:hypothetical protein C1H46_012882 [Malus baccata]
MTDEQMEQGLGNGGLFVTDVPWLLLQWDISDNHTNNNPNIVEIEPENDAIEESLNEASLAGDEDNHVNQAIMHFVMRGDWDTAMELLKRHPEVVTARIREGGTILHWAFFFKKVDIAKEMVNLMRPKDLEIQDYVGLTALHRVITGIPESVELAKCMVEKNKKLLSIVLPPDKTIPLLAGKITPLIQAQGHEEGEKMAQYLYSVTPHKNLNDSECALLIIQGLMLKRFVHCDKTSKQVDVKALKETIWNHAQESVQISIQVC